MHCNGGKKKSGWNNMEELKYLICAIDCHKCPRVPPAPSCSVLLPPRIEELPWHPPPRKPPCPPPPRCCPITPGPCCPPPLPPPAMVPIARQSQAQPAEPRCCYRSPLPCYPTYCQ